MYKFLELKKATKLDISEKEMRLAILGNCSTQFLAVSVEGYAKLSGINLKVYDADYNQINEQLIDSMSQTYNFKPDYILLYFSSEKLYEEFIDAPINERDDFANRYIDRIKKLWGYIVRQADSKILQMNFTEHNDKVLGQYSAKVESTFTYQIRKLNYLLEEEMRVNKNVYPIDLLDIQLKLGQSVFYSSAYYYNAKMAISKEALPYVSKAVVDVISSMMGKIKKCIVLDLDNTLWGGVIGDDGINNIEIGELGRGHAFSNFQRWLKQLKENGIILAVCSKNNEDIAKEPFEKLDEMILRLDDISMFVANWEDKATNIRRIQKMLNIGMDSIVFIDDNPFERNLVKDLLPEVCVPDMPEDPADYIEYLEDCNLFDVVSYAGMDSDRTKQYQSEIARKELQIAYESIDDYLKGLEMKGCVKEFDESHYSRIAQLSQRSNQFNLRTIRYTEDEIRRISEENNIALYYTLKDRFGDYGLVGVIIAKPINQDTVFIDTWLMSCRVLKRGMEEFIINQFVKYARDKSYKKIEAEYIKTAKNDLVKDIYIKMGFSKKTNDYYELIVDDYAEIENFIAIEGNHC